MATSARQVIRIGDRDVPYRIRYSRRASRLTLRLSHRDGLEVVVPARATQSDIEGLVMSKAAWVARRLKDFALRQASSPTIEFRDGAPLQLLGRNYILRLSGAARVRAHVSLSEQEIHLAIPSAGGEGVREALERWLLRFARSAIPERVGALNAACGLSFRRISIRSQRTRWGSCSRKGTLSFNWRLVLLPPAVMDYLIYHELAHLREMNHSPRFWRIVEGWCPEFRDAERWLKLHGPFVIA